MGLFTKRAERYDDEPIYDDYSSRQSRRQDRGPRPGRPWGKVIVIRKGDKKPSYDDDIRYRGNDDVRYRGNDMRPLPRYERAQSAERYFSNGSVVSASREIDQDGTQRFIPIRRQIITEQPAKREIRREIVPVERTYVETKPAIQKEIVEVAPVPQPQIQREIVYVQPPPPPPQKEIVYVREPTPPPPPKEVVYRTVKEVREEPEYVTGRLVEVNSPHQQPRLVPLQRSLNESRVTNDRELLRREWVRGPEHNYTPLNRRY